jgi:D-alanyl-lipoteichoic acid acyltransferase DltB (MBOAT superfamily)
MLFHSYQFMLGFLPVCFVIFGLIIHNFGWQAGVIWLCLASIFFYGQWSTSLAMMLVGSIVVNYTFALGLQRYKDNKRASSAIFGSAMVSNLVFLGYFKYTNFFIDNINVLSGFGIQHVETLFLVGVSFYTFIQIGFLVELYTRQATLVPFHHYFLFSCFFPCVTAGPLLLQKEMMPQLAEQKEPVFDRLRIAIALTIIAIGLFKKLVLADSIAPYADTMFNGVAAGASVATADAWVGALAYTLQLYFDFSGYSDMAIGIGHLFGFRLPLNFNSPLKATSIIEFWRRWHMTMTRFFTNYLYTPVGITMMRRAMKRRYSRRLRFLVAVVLPVVFTFVLAGIWHGAGWTYVVFGLIHGVALASNHAWREAGGPAMPRVVAWLLTMAVVVTGLVVFRAADLDVALTVYASMLGLPAVAGAASAVPAVTVDLVAGVALIVVLGAITLLLPNTQEIMRHHRISTAAPSEVDAGASRRLSWRPSPAWATATVVLLVISLGLITGESSFIYYQF